MKRTMKLMLLALIAMAAFGNPARAAITISLPSGFTFSDLSTAAWTAVSTPLYLTLGLLLVLVMVKWIVRFFQKVFR